MSDEIKDSPEVLLEKLRKANAEAKDWREKYEGAQTALEAANTYKEKTLKASVLASLKEQGIKNPERVLKLVDLEGVSLDDDGKLAGLDEKVKTVKTDFPELFDRKREVGGAADVFTKGEGPKPLTGTEAQVKRLFAGSR